MNRDVGTWREHISIEPGPPPPKRVEPGNIRVTFINHSTALIQLDGVNILTDPVYSRRVSPVTFAGPIRHKPPGIRFEDLPPIDIILLSHNHYDHLDISTLKRLAAAHTPAIYTSLGNTAYLASRKIERSVDMDWWDAMEHTPGMRITCVPARHFSGRGMRDRNKTLWCGFVVESPSGTIYFAADTGAGPHFAEIKRRFPNITLAMLPIGAYRPRWFMAPMHMGPDDAVDVHKLLAPKLSMGIHFGTFALADDGEDEPVELLNATLDAQGVPRETFWAPGNGEAKEIV